MKEQTNERNKKNRAEQKIATKHKRKQYNSVERQREQKKSKQKRNQERERNRETKWESAKRRIESNGSSCNVLSLLMKIM